VIVKDSFVFVTVRLSFVLIEEPDGVIVTVVPDANAILAAVAIVTVTFCEFVPSRVTDGGLKLHVAPVGSPLQLDGVKLTVGVAPPIGATVIVYVAEVPAAIEAVAGEDESINCGADAATQANARLFTSTEPRPFTRL
jgi:hypothetical protein